MVEAAAQIRAPIERSAPDAIRLERILDAPVEKVWRYLTEADLRQQWFMGGTDAKPDSEFELLVDHDKLSSDDVPYPESHECFKGAVWTEKVLRFEPPRLLETTFQGGKNGIVTYELSPEGGKPGSSSRTATLPAQAASRISAAAGRRTSRFSRSGLRGVAYAISGSFTRGRARQSRRRWPRLSAPSGWTPDGAYDDLDEVKRAAEKKQEADHGDPGVDEHHASWGDLFPGVDRG